jgi:hypothetical protein
MTSYIPGSNSAIANARSGARTGIFPHGLICLNTLPLRVHRHSRTVETAAQPRREEARRMAH